MTQQGPITEAVQPPHVEPRIFVLLGYWALAALMIAQVVSKLGSEKLGFRFGTEIFAAVFLLARAGYLTRKRILALRG